MRTERCQTCNKEVSEQEMISADSGDGYIPFCSESCGTKYVKKYAKDFLFRNEE